MKYRGGCNSQPHWPWVLLAAKLCCVLIVKRRHLDLCNACCWILVWPATVKHCEHQADMHLRKCIAAEQVQRVAMAAAKGRSPFPFSRCGKMCTAVTHHCWEVGLTSAAGSYHCWKLGREPSVLSQQLIPYYRMTFLDQPIPGLHLSPRRFPTKFTLSPRLVSSTAQLTCLDDKVLELRFCMKVTL